MMIKCFDELFSYTVQTTTLLLANVVYSKVTDYVNMNVIVVVILNNYESRSVNNFCYDIFFSLDYVIDVFCYHYGSEVTLTSTYW